MASGSDDTDSVEGVVETARDAGEGETISVGEIVDGIGARAYGPLLFFIGLITVSPIGAIPGAPNIIVLLVVLLMGQALLRDGAPWLPERLRDFSVGRERMEGALDKVKPWLSRLDRITRRRMEHLMTPGWLRVWHSAALAMGIALLPLSLIPFAANLPGLGFAVLGLALMTEDGAAALVASAIGLATLAMTVWAVMSLIG